MAAIPGTQAQWNHFPNSQDVGENDSKEFSFHSQHHTKKGEANNSQYFQRGFKIHLRSMF